MNQRKIRPLFDVAFTVVPLLPRVVPKADNDFSHRVAPNQHKHLAGDVSPAHVPRLMLNRALVPGCACHPRAV